MLVAIFKLMVLCVLPLFLVGSKFWWLMPYRWASFSRQHPFSYSTAYWAAVHDRIRGKAATSSGMSLRVYRYYPGNGAQCRKPLSKLNRTYTRPSVLVYSMPQIVLQPLVKRASIRNLTEELAQQRLRPGPAR